MKRMETRAGGSVDIFGKKLIVREPGEWRITDAAGSFSPRWSVHQPSTSRRLVSRPMTRPRGVSRGLPTRRNVASMIARGMAGEGDGRHESAGWRRPGGVTMTSVLLVHGTCCLDHHHGRSRRYSGSAHA